MYFVSDAGGGWNVRVRLQAKAGGAMGCAIATTLGMILQTARQLSEMAFGSIFVSALAVMESLWSHYTCTKLYRSGGASKPAYLHMHTLQPASHQRWPHSQLTPSSARAVAA